MLASIIDSMIIFIPLTWNKNVSSVRGNRGGNAACATVMKLLHMIPILFLDCCRLTCDKTLSRFNEFKFQLGLKIAI